MIDFSAHPLVETTWLAAHLSDSNVRIVDARWRGDGSSRELYQRGHLPGAIHLDWHADLSWTNERGVRDLLLPPEPFATVMEAVGIGDQTRVVVYTETDHSGQRGSGGRCASMGTNRWRCSMGDGPNGSRKDAL